MLEHRALHERDERTTAHSCTSTAQVTTYLVKHAPRRMILLFAVSVGPDLFPVFRQTPENRLIS